MHAELESTCQRVRVDLPYARHSPVNVKFTTKYVLQLQKKQLLDHHKQQQYQSPRQMMTILTPYPLTMKANTLLVN